MAILSQIDAKQTEKVLNLFPDSLKRYVEDLKNSKSESFNRFKALKANEKNEIFLAEGLKAIEQCYFTTTADKAIIESHRKYIDFQFLFEGEEIMETAFISKMQIKKPFDEERDLIVYEESTELHHLKMKTGDYAIFFPEDAHRSTLQKNGETLVRKVVVKIPV